MPVECSEITQQKPDSVRFHMGESVDNIPSASIFRFSPPFPWFVLVRQNRPSIAHIRVLSTGAHKAPNHTHKSRPRQEGQAQAPQHALITLFSRSWAPLSWPIVPESSIFAGPCVMSRKKYDCHYYFQKRRRLFIQSPLNRVAHYNIYIYIFD